MNEMRAYFMHTPDSWFFNLRDDGVLDDRLAALQADFLLGMPGDWLHDCTPPPAPKQHSAKRRRPTGRRLVGPRLPGRRRELVSLARSSGC